MSSSDQITKQELADIISPVKSKFPGLKVRLFTEGSNLDQKLFSEGGCTFQYNNIKYGSCDAVIEYKDIIIGIEMTDALNRGSSGSAQVQRFHHALGAVKNGYIGVYYLRKGNLKIQPVLYGMAHNATKYEKGSYLITQNLDIIKDILNSYNSGKAKLEKFISDQLSSYSIIFNKYFNDRFKNSWSNFAEKRSSIILDDCIIKYLSSNYKSFTDSSLRAGHITLGEFFLGKYLFEDILTSKKTYYFLLPRLDNSDLVKLNQVKENDKEWQLMQLNENSEIKKISDLTNLPNNLFNQMLSIKNSKMTNGSSERKIYDRTVKKIVEWIKENKFNFT